MMGIILIIISAITTAIGIFIQKLAFIDLKKNRRIYLFPKWIFGVLLTMLAVFVYVFALKYERIVIIQPIGSLSILVLIILEAFFLKTRFSSRDMLSVLLFILGITLICVF